MTTTDVAGRKVAVIGLGLIGGSLALLLRERGVIVSGVDHSPTTVAAARERGIDAHTTLPDAIMGASLIVLAVPLRAMAATATSLASHIHFTADATITDVGSVKAPIREAVTDAGLGERYIGAHPMAGSQYSGFAAATAALVDGAPWAVSTDSGDPVRRRELVELIEGPLHGTVVEVSDAEHDEAVALVSHVPHVLATWLLNSVAGAPVRETALQLAAGSFRDGTRVALTDPVRTEAMVQENSLWVAPALRKAARDLAALADRLENNADTSAFFHAADSVREHRRAVLRAVP
jgi:prephenate dehydrogenase